MKTKKLLGSMYELWGFKVKFAQKRPYEIRHFRDRPPKINMSSCLKSDPTQHIQNYRASLPLIFPTGFENLGCKQPKYSKTVQNKCV